MASDRIGIRLRLLHRYSGFESANRPDEVRLAQFHFRFSIEVHRNPQFRRLRKTKILRHHTKHLAAFSTALYTPVNNAPTAGKALLPQSITEPRHLIITGLFVFQQEGPA